MPPKSQFFSKEIESRLVEEVEKRPLLWDAKANIYRRADLKPLAWEEIATIIGPPFTGKFFVLIDMNVYKAKLNKNLFKLKLFMELLNLIICHN